MRQNIYVLFTESGKDEIYKLKKYCTLYGFRINTDASSFNYKFGKDCSNLQTIVIDYDPDSTTDCELDMLRDVLFKADYVKDNINFCPSKHP